MLAPQSGIIAGQQSARVCTPLFDRHANAGAAVHKRTAANIKHATFLPNVMI